MKYEEMLNKAMKEIPKQVVEKTRFEVPLVKGHIEGNKTIIANFIQICDVIHREPSLLLKYLQRELATPASIDGQRLILGRKISSNSVNEKIIQFVKFFVTCKECGKPDTELFKENRVLFLKCMACGAKYPIKA